MNCEEDKLPPNKMYFPDGNGTLHLIDLQPQLASRIDLFKDVERNLQTIAFTLYTRWVYLKFSAKNSKELYINTIIFFIIIICVNPFDVHRTSWQ